MPYSNRRKFPKKNKSNRSPNLNRSSPKSFSYAKKSYTKKSDEKKPEIDTPTPHYLYGIHPVEEAIKKNYIFKKLYLQKGEAREHEKGSSNQEVWIQYCQKKKIQFHFTEKKELDQKVNRANHQGVVVELKESTRLIADLELFLNQLDSVEDKVTSKIILIADHITDQQNIGAMARSAFYFGCPLILTEDHHSAPLDSTIHKASSGASLLIPFHQCEKLSQAIETLKNQGYYILASSLSEVSIPLNQIQFSKEVQQGKKIALIMGAEGDGIRPHLLRLADIVICIEGSNDFDSLNVSVATGILLYQLKQLLG